jgi:hypothetical protein
MIKLYITAIETKDNGQAVTLFEDFMVTGKQIEQGDLHEIIYNKIEEVELANEQATKPF